MNDNLSFKSIIQPKPFNFNLALNEYCERTINLIDIDSETILIGLGEDDEQKCNYINQTREIFIKEIKNYQDRVKNHPHIKESHIGISYLPKKMLFNSSCFYLDSKTLEKFRYTTDKLGILVFTDFYLSDEECNSFKKWFEIFDRVIPKNIQEKKSNESKNILKYICLIEEIKAAIQNEKSIVHLEKNIYKKFDGIRLLYSKLVDLEDDSVVLENIKTLILDEIYLSVFERNLFPYGFCKKAYSNIESLRLSTAKQFRVPFNSQSFICFPYLRILRLKNCGIEEINQGMFSCLSNLQELDLSINSLRSIKENAFEGLKNLVKLDLHMNDLFEIHAKAFSALTSLKSLDLFKNDYYVNVEAFECIKTLEVLCIDMINISKTKSIDWGSMLPNLKEFQLSSFCETDPDYFVYNFKSLERFCIDDYIPIIRLPESAKTLKHLTLTGYDIDSPVNDIFRHVYNIEQLYLYDFSILCKNKYLERSYRNMKSLKDLYIVFDEWNDLTNINFLMVIFSTRGDLRKLTLKNMKIELLGKNEIKQKNLEMIDLRNGRIKYINRNTFKYMVNLQQLRLSSNQIEYIDSNIFCDALKYLEILELDSNNIKIIVHDSFRNLDYLKNLDLHSNKIKRIEADTFCYLTNLESLNLSDNLIEEIDINGFRNINKLRRLNLRGNNIKNLTGYHLGHLPLLESIDISRNKIESIEGIFIDNLQLKDIYFNGNPITNVNILGFVKFKSLKSLSLDENLIKENDKKIMFYFINTMNVNLNFQKTEGLTSIETKGLDFQIKERRYNLDYDRY